MAAIKNLQGVRPLYPAGKPGHRRFQLWLGVILLSLLPPAVWGAEKVSMGRVTTTNYCEGRVTSSDKKIKPGYMALSRDLARQHHLKFGDFIYLEGEDEPYIFEDYLPRGYTRHADFFSRQCKSARKYGLQKRLLWFLKK